MLWRPILCSVLLSALPLPSAQAETPECAERLTQLEARVKHLEEALARVSGMNGVPRESSPAAPGWSLTDLNGARAVPYFRDGAPVGMRLFAIKPGSRWERFGLENGDIVLEVDGSKLTDVTIGKLAEALTSARQIKVERNRTEMVISSPDPAHTDQ